MSGRARAGRTSFAWLLTGTVVALAATTTSSRARADTATERALFGLSVEAFGGTNVDRAGADLFGPVVGGSLDVELNPHALLGITAGGTFVAFTADQASKGATWAGGRLGVRLHWGVLIGASNDAWVDVHGNFGQSAGVSRPGIDVAAAYTISVVNGFRVGPMIRYQWSSNPGGTDPSWIEFGIAIGIFGASRSADDPDDDDVPNARDQCPTEPAGARPDPTRPGCSMRDQDGDNVFDADDACPAQSAGARPDPVRNGCPLGDADGDGVSDAQDACPTTPVGARPDRARRGCPFADQDGDLVSDAADPCPTLPPGAHPDGARPGCPMLDRDGDTVMDDADHCPNEPGAPSRDAERNGCPGLVRVDAGRIHILRPLYFATGRDVILEESFPVLAAVTDAALAGGYPHIRIEGHTDDRGNDQQNMELSRRRAQSVMRWLVGSGVAQNRLEAVGLGETQPIEPNDNELGRAANRRVEFHIVVPSAVPSP